MADEQGAGMKGAAERFVETEIPSRTIEDRNIARKEDSTQFATKSIVGDLAGKSATPTDDPRSGRQKLLVIRRNAAAPPSNGCTLETDSKLSESLLWTWQRDFYSGQGMRLWKQASIPGNVVTTSPYIAKAYARVALGFLRDCARFTSLRDDSELGSIVTDKPIYIFELGSGSGRFGFAFLKQFVSLKRLLCLDDIQVRYVMTDFAEDNLRHWLENPTLRPFVESGILDFALYDASRSDEIKLHNAGEIISRESLRNPVIVFANYFFDSIEQDVFRVERGQLYEGLVTLSSKVAEEADSTNPDIIGRMEVNLRYQPCSTDYYSDPSDPELNRILTYYEQHLSDTSFSLPLGALRCIRDFIDLSSGQLLLLSADNGYYSEEQLASAAGDLQIAIEGSSVSLMLNFHALQLYIHNRGGFSLENAQPRPGLGIAAFLLGASRSSFSETVFAFQDNFSNFGPNECYTLVQEASAKRRIPSVEYILCLLRLSEWDPWVLYRFRAALQEGVKMLPVALKEDLAKGLNQAWENHLPIGEEMDLAFEIGTLLQKMECPATAMRYYELSLRLFGDHFATLHNLGLCCYQLGRSEDALGYFDKALALKSDFAQAKEWHL